MRRIFAGATVKLSWYEIQFYRVTTDMIIMTAWLIIVKKKIARGYIYCELIASFE